MIHASQTHRHGKYELTLCLEVLVGLSVHNLGWAGRISEILGQNMRPTFTVSRGCIIYNSFGNLEVN